MIFDGIITESGQQLDEATLNPIMGYQCMHKQTGRLLPSCQRFEIYGWNAMLDKIANVTEFHDDGEKLLQDYFDITEYDIEPIYMSETDGMNTGFIFIMNEQDVDEDGDMYNH